MKFEDKGQTSVPLKFTDLRATVKSTLKFSTTILNLSSLRLLAFFCAFTFSQIAMCASSVETRYGRAEIVSDGDKYAVLFKGKEIAIFEGHDVGLYRITPNGQNEYLIIDIGKNGLNCRHEFSIFEISPQLETFVSKQFGECAELQGVKYLLDGVFVELRSTVIGTKKQKISKYLWVNRKIRKQ